MASNQTVLWEVDAQVDFLLPGGKLYVPGAEKIIPNLKRLVELARQGRAFLVSSCDAHAPDDPEFERFPPHCVKGTPGAQIIPEGLAPSRLTVPSDCSFRLPTTLSGYAQIVLEKAALDVFANPKTARIVQMLGTRAEYAVFGVVTEYCVRCAAQGLLERGCRVAIVRDAIETLKPEQGQRALGQLQALGARLVSTDQAVAAIEQAAPQGAG